MKAAENNISDAIWGKQMKEIQSEKKYFTENVLQQVKTRVTDQFLSSNKNETVSNSEVIYENKQLKHQLASTIDEIENLKSLLRFSTEKIETLAASHNQLKKLISEQFVDK